MDITAARDLLYGGGATALALYLGKLVLARIGAGERAGTAGSEALLAIIKQQEATIKRLEERDVAATERADKAERERNEALSQIDRLTFTVQTLRDEVQGLRKQIAENGKI